MNWPFVLPILFLLLPAVLYVIGGRRKNGGLFRQTLPQLLLLFLTSAAVSLLHSSWLRDLPHAPRLRFFLWLFFWFFMVY